VFAIFGFFSDLLWILQGSAEIQKGVRNLFANRPSESIECLSIYPWFAQITLERTPVLQCGPRPRGRRGRPDSGEADGGDGRGKAGEGSRATRVRSTCSLAAKTMPVGERGGGRRRPPLGVRFRR
jgi:hypothetical protein